MAEARPTVAFLGTGIMGAPMARNVAGAGLPVRAWNRTREKAEPLAEHGVEIADSAPAAVEGADVGLAAAVEERFSRAADAGLGDCDMAAVARLSEASDRRS